MEKMSLSEIKDIELGILIKIDELCRMNNIKYSLCGGTLLGAIRHGGFIPWDDDIDITMTRENYAKFIHCMATAPDDNLVLVDYNHKNYGYMFSKVCDSRTVLIEKYNKRVNSLGVYVDIFPVDYLDDSLQKSIRKMNRLKLKKYILVAWNWKSFYLNKTKNKSRQLMRLFFFVLSRFVSKNMMINSFNRVIRKQAERKHYSGCFFGSYGNRDILETSFFESFCELEFEGHRFMCFSNYRFYLEQLYGDYMQLPPEGSRINHHTFDAFWK